MKLVSQNRRTGLAFLLSAVVDIGKNSDSNERAKT